MLLCKGGIDPHFVYFSKGMVYETRWIKGCVKRRTKRFDVLLCDVIDQSVRLIK